MMGNSKLIAALAGISLLACSPDGETTLTDARSICGELVGASIAGERKSFSLDFNGAERSFRKVIELHKTSETAPECSSAMTLAQAYTNLGLSLSSQQQFKLANAAFEEADRLLQNSPAPSPIDLAQLNTFRAYHALNQEKLTEVTSHTSKVEKAFDDGELLVGTQTDSLFALSPEEQISAVSFAQALHAQSFAQLGEDHIASTKSINQALYIIGDKFGKDSPIKSRLVLQKALTDIASGEVESAIEGASKAVEQLSKNLPDTPLAARAHRVLGSALYQAGRTDEAYTSFAKSLDIYEENPVPLKYERIWPLVKLAAESSSSLTVEDPEKVELLFRAAQLVKSAKTASDIAAAAAQKEEGDSQSGRFVRQWRAAQEETTQLRVALSRRELLLPDQINQLSRQLDKATETEATLRERLEAVAPDFIRALEAPVTISQIQQALAEDEVLVQIIPGEPQSLMIVIDRNGAEAEILEVGEAEFRETVKTLRRAFEPENIDSNGPKIPFDVKKAYELQQQLFGNRQEEIFSKKKLVISTSGSLLSLPFELLVAEPSTQQAGQNGDYTSVAWLADKIDVNYVPLPRNLVDLRGQGQTSVKARALLGFGDYKPGSTAEQILAAEDLPSACGEDARLIASLSPLEHAYDELDYALKAVGEDGSQLILGDDFTESEVNRLSQDKELTKYQIIHFATHGLLWNSPDCFREPSLTTSTSVTAGGSGLLTSSEIRSLEIDAQLIVLSACSTAGGDGALGVGGENLSGLARAFFSNGAQSVVATHWLVSDAASAATMILFYTELTKDEGVTFREALTRAQSVVRQQPNRSHPFYWASFVMLGDGNGALTSANLEAS